MVGISELKCRVFGMGHSNPETRYKKKVIEDIPIMISGDKLVCIPKTDEVKHVGAVGMTGTAKSIFLNSQLSFRYNLTNRLAILLNDYQKETFEWSQKSKNKVFRKVFSLIGLEPMPNPIVFVLPSTKTSQIDKKYEKFSLVGMTIPMQDAVRNIEYFHPLDKSKLYLGNIKDELIECNSIGEIENVLNESFSQNEQRLMKFKMLNVFQDLFENKILNVSEPGSPAYLTVEQDGEIVYRNKLIQSLLYAGVIPSIQTSDLCNYDFFSAYMSYIVESIYENQYHDSYFSNKTISLFVDEIDKLWDGLNGELIKKSLCRCGTNGRMARIELIWATQHYDKVPKKIRDNTKFLIVSRQKDAKDVREIAKDFSIPKSFINEMEHLVTDGKNGKFEAVCLSAGENFVLYDLVTGQRTICQSPRKGLLIPPISEHRKP